MDIQKLRQDRGWSQEQLAEMADVSARTIQRIETGQAASPETLKALAAVFEISLKDLQETDASAKSRRKMLSPMELRVLAEIRSQRAFYIHLFFYVTICAFLFLINLLTWRGYVWAVWPFLGWGIGVLMHGITVIRPLRNFGADWERREFKKRMQEKTSRN